MAFALFSITFIIIKDRAAVNVSVELLDTFIKKSKVGS
ncbi:hypothetical protein SPYJRS4_0144 [Streptococcus pyogenes JRS4]|nr:hypothetical protein SPYJRS4_0144 [Streptococcus pyogenes JRS4]